MSTLRIQGAREHNLRGFDLELVHDQLVVITGVSGSGKSSLAFDTIFREGERRYLSTLSSHARRLLGRLDPPRVDRIDGVRPTIAIDQRAVRKSARSTVGTLSEIGDELRLLLARFGARSRGDNRPLTRSLFSFNTEDGACPACRGLGVEDFVDPDRIVADPDKTLREGALVPTTPNGYIVYSQVTPDVMNTVCAAHGFDIDTPWKALTAEQHRVVFYGSDRVKVPFGKHSLESRMKWSGIKAKPRELGHYRGIANVIGETLAKKRNDNILRFVTSRSCTACAGTRLNEDARSVRIGDVGIVDLLGQTIADLPARLARATTTIDDEAAGLIVARLAARADRFVELGLGHLTIDRSSGSISSGEARRIRLANQLGTDLSGVAYVFDEPSVGAHVEDRERIASLLIALRDRGNSIFVVEHDLAFRRAADTIVRIGPGAGRHGGALEYVGPPRPEDLDAGASTAAPRTVRTGPWLTLRGACGHNLRNIDVAFVRGAFNVVTGVSGAGKSTLVDHTLARALVSKIHRAAAIPLPFDSIDGADDLSKVVVVDQSEIGRTPRSNPATYSGVFDLIRQRFSNTDEAIRRGFDKGRFSFNKAGGRCAVCEGAGVELIGLMSLPTVALVCGACDGQRFDADTLAVTDQKHTILDVLNLTIDEAKTFYADEPKIRRILDALVTVGLGYLTLGQPATTLSGGEAQRLKLAKELARSDGAGTLILLDEPTSGLSTADVTVLIAAIDALVDSGATVIAVEHDLDVLTAADWVVDLGPGAGVDGGTVVVAGPPSAIAAAKTSKTGAALRKRAVHRPRISTAPRPARNTIELRGVRTHNLDGVDVDVPLDALTVVTGVSGSGKSSLVFDTLAAVGRQRFIESFSPYARQNLRASFTAAYDRADGLRPTIAIRARSTHADPRSTVGTATRVDPMLRLLFARLGQGFDGPRPTAGHFSFNHAAGACTVCDGRGTATRVDINRVVVDPTRSIADGVLAGTRGGRLLFEVEGRLHAILAAFLDRHGTDLDAAWSALSAEAHRLVVDGSDQMLDVTWQHAAQKGEAAHVFRATWPGVAALVQAEFEKKRERKTGPAFAELLAEVRCSGCDGERLTPELRAIHFAGRRLPEVRAFSVVELRAFLRAPPIDPVLQTIADAIVPTLDRLETLGLGYLTTDRQTSTLSTGERRRLEIATQLVGGLVDVCYVLDEPCLGLHHQDREQLAAALLSLAARGNAVVVVEHDETLIRHADHVIDLGPGAGAAGGSIVATGSWQDVAAEPNSATGRFLGGRARVERSRAPAVSTAGPSIVGAHLHNLASVDLSVRFGELLAVCGVSGSGKSSLVLGVLADSLAAGHAIGCAGVHDVHPVVRIEARTGGGGPRQTVATYLDLLGHLAAQYAAAPQAQAQKLKRAAFLFAGKQGRCPVCDGTGIKRVPLDFIPDAVSPCAACDGTRYREEVRAIRIDERNIAETLGLPASAAVDTLSDHKHVRSTLDQMNRFGLGHVALDRRVDSLSGGETQRLAMVRELTATGASGTSASNKVFVFDEPSRGLHPQDLNVLVELFEALAHAGHAVVFTEHNLRLIAIADRVVELGPGAADDGGRIVFDGAPRDLVDTATGRALRMLR